MDTELLMQSYQGLIYDEIADYEQTIAGLSAHLQADPTNSHAFNNRAVAHWEIGRIAEAWEGFRARRQLILPMLCLMSIWAGCSNSAVTSARPLRRIAQRCSDNLLTRPTFAVAPWHCVS